MYNDYMCHVVYGLSLPSRFVESLNKQRIQRNVQCTIMENRRLFLVVALHFSFDHKSYIFYNLIIFYISIGRMLYCCVCDIMFVNVPDGNQCVKQHKFILYNIERRGGRLVFSKPLGCDVCSVYNIVIISYLFPHVYISLYIGTTATVKTSV